MTKRLPLNHPKRHMTDEERANCIIRYKAGESRYKLADDFDRDKRTIDRLLKRENALRGL